MTNASTVKAQDDTLRFADHWGEAWTPDEAEFVAKHTETMSDHDIAIHLGRSLYAIWAIQHRLRTVGFDPDAARAMYAREEARPVVVCTVCRLAVPATGVCDEHPDA